MHVCLLGETSKKRQKCLLQELEDDAIPSTVRDKVKEESNNRHAGHEFQSFSFKSISTVTSDFSIENKLGQGGFNLGQFIRFSLSLFVCVREIKFEHIRIIIKC